MLKTKVLVRQVSNLHDARYCAGMGVDYISMSLKDKEGKVKLAPAQIKEIGDWLSGIQIVGDIGDTLTEDLPDYQLGVIETDNSQLIKQLIEYQKSIVLNLSVTEGDLLSPSFRGLLDQLKGEIDFFVLLCEGNHESYNTELIKELIIDNKIYWGFDFNTESVIDFVDKYKPNGIVLQGSKEIKTGLNDFDHLADILEALDTDEYA